MPADCAGSAAATAAARRAPHVTGALVAPRAAETPPAPSAEERARTEADAEAAAHVRWGDADAMQVVIKQRTSEFSAWSDVARLASVAEATLLGRLKDATARAFVRPFAPPDPARRGHVVVPLGVSATRAALVARTRGDGDEEFYPSKTLVCEEDEPERFATSEGVIYNVNDESASIDDGAYDGLANGRYREVREPPVARGALELWTCPVSRSASLMWTKSERVLDAPPRASAAHGDDLALVLADASAVIVVRMPACTEVVFRAELPATKRGAGATCALNDHYLVVTLGATVVLWRRDGATPLRATYVHDAAVTCAQLDACTRPASRLLLCGDERGRVVGLVFGVTDDAAATATDKRALEFAQPSVTRLARATVDGVAFNKEAPVRALAFGGSRIAVATDASLVIVDRQRASAPGAARPARDVGPLLSASVLPRGAPATRSIEHHIYESVYEARDGGVSARGPLRPTAALALWGDALIALDARNLLRVYDVPVGELTSAPLGAKAVRDIAAPRTGAQLVAAACDQVAALLADGTLVLLNADV